MKLFNKGLQEFKQILQHFDKMKMKEKWTTVHDL